MMTGPRGIIDRIPPEMATTASQYMTRITYYLAICELAMSGQNVNQFLRCLTYYIICFSIPDIDTTTHRDGVI